MLSLSYNKRNSLTKHADEQTECYACVFFWRVRHICQYVQAHKENEPNAKENQKIS